MEMKTLGEVLKLSIQYLKAKDPVHSRRDVELLFSHIFKIKRLDLYLNFDRPLVESELTSIREGLKRLANHEPIQYIEGQVDFFNCKLRVSRSALIPRPETELLVDKIVKELKTQELSGKVLLDLCSGSGCIGIAIKKELPELRVVLIDLSYEAIELAKENARENSVSVECLQGNLFEPLHSNKVDFLVCNPPYLSEAEYEKIDLSVKNFEPKMALVSGESGLEFYKEIAKRAKEHVTRSIWLEIGATQGSAVQKLFLDQGYKAPLLEKDLAGHDRFITVNLKLSDLPVA